MITLTLIQVLGNVSYYILCFSVVSFGEPGVSYTFSNIGAVLAYLSSGYFYEKTNLKLALSSCFALAAVSSFSLVLCGTEKTNGWVYLFLTLS